MYKRFGLFLIGVGILFSVWTATKRYRREVTKLPSAATVKKESSEVGEKNVTFERQLEKKEIEEKSLIVREIPTFGECDTPLSESVTELTGNVDVETYISLEALFDTPLKKRLKRLGVSEGAPLYVRIFKKEAVLELWVEKEGRYVPLKFYRICAYSGKLGPKLKEGDKQAPEGFYRVYPRQLNPKSRFHLAFNLGYPNAYDRAHGRTGSYLMVHGDCVSVGCYAMTDEKIEEIYAMVASALKHGQRYVPVHIFPFRMEDTTMDDYSEHRWYDFWMELKEGYDYFEAEEIPPNVTVKNGRYVIEEAMP